MKSKLLLLSIVAMTGLLAIVFTRPVPAQESPQAISGNAGWEEVGQGSASDTGIQDAWGANSGPSLVVPPDGQPILARSVGYGPTEIYVWRWNGSDWTEMGNGSASGGGISDTTGQSDGPSLALNPSGVPIIAWHDDSPYDAHSEIYVKRWNGSDWVEMGGSASGSGISNSSIDSMWPSLAIDSSGKPIVAWMHGEGNTFDIYVKRWNGSEWKEMGSGSASGKGISKNNGISASPSVAITPAGMPIVTWFDNSSGEWQIYLKRWNGSDWVEIGSGSASGGGISKTNASSFSPSLAIMPSGNLIIAWLDSSDVDQEIYVRRWTGSEWEEMGSGSDSGGGISNNNGTSSSPSLAVASDGTPIIAWDDVSSGDWEIYVRRWNGSNWVQMDSGSATGGGISDTEYESEYPSLAIGPDNRPMVAWRENEQLVYVRRYEGGEPPRADVKITGYEFDWFLNDPATLLVDVCLENNGSIPIEGQVQLFVGGTEIGESQHFPELGAVLSPEASDCITIIGSFEHSSGRFKGKLRAEAQIDGYDDVYPDDNVYEETVKMNWVDFALGEDDYWFENDGYTSEDFLDDLWALGSNLTKADLLRIIARFQALGYLAEWNGKCFGMASTSILYWREPLFRPGNYSNTNAMTMEDAMPMIRKYQRNQLLIDPKISIWPDNINQFGQVADRLSEGPVQINMRSTISGHSIVAYRTLQADDTRIISVYDNNSPGNTQQLAIDNSGKLDYSGPGSGFNRFVPDRTYKLPDDKAAEIASKIAREWQIDDGVINILVDSAVEALMLDSQGRRIGLLNGVEINEMPQGQFWRIGSQSIFSLPKSGDYIFQAKGSSSASTNNSAENTTFVVYSVPIADDLLLDVTFDSVQVKAGEIYTTTISDDPDDVPPIQSSDGQTTPPDSIDLLEVTRPQVFLPVISNKWDQDVSPPPPSTATPSPTTLPPPTSTPTPSPTALPSPTPTPTATATPPGLILTIETSGSGYVLTSPLKSYYTYGEEVTLTAAGDAGWKFVRWSGDLSGSTNPAAITMNSHRTVIAIFE